MLSNTLLVIFLKPIGKFWNLRAIWHTGKSLRGLQDLRKSGSIGYGAGDGWIQR